MPLMAPANKPGTGPVRVVTVPTSTSDRVIPGPAAGPWHKAGDTASPATPEPPATGLGPVEDVGVVTPAVPVWPEVAILVEVSGPRVVRVDAAYGFDPGAEAGPVPVGLAPDPATAPPPMTARLRMASWVDESRDPHPAALSKEMALTAAASFLRLVDPPVRTATS